MPNPTARSRLISIGIGLDGLESHTYAVPIPKWIPFSSPIFQLPGGSLFQEYGQWWRIVRVRVLCQMQFVKRP